MVYTSVIPAFGRWRQEDNGFEASQGYIGRLSYYVCFSLMLSENIICAGL
jgi:hypothetical protein